VNPVPFVICNYTFFGQKLQRKKTEDRGRRAEDGGWRAEDGGWRAEDGGQKKEGRGRKSNGFLGCARNDRLEIATAFGLAMTFLIDSSDALGMTLKMINDN